MFANDEYADMYLILGECRNNAAAAANRYRERYPLRRHPSSNVFRRLDRRIRETGNVAPTGAFYRDRGRPRTSRTPQVEEAVLELSAEDPTLSSREIAASLEIPHSMVGRIIHDEQLHPYHYTKVQTLLPTDYPKREQFCNWFLQQVQENPNFGENILWTDEANFTRDGFFNSRNSHYYAYENPHVFRPTNHQHRFSVNVWAGIIGNRLVGPIIIPDRLAGQHFLEFLQNGFQDLVDELPLALLNNIWLQMDGAPAHHAAPVRNWLNEHFAGRWIGRGGPFRWPPRSPDLTPMDFFLWGHIKSKVYHTPVLNQNDLINRIFDAARTINEEMLVRVQNNLIRRTELCREQHGQNFEHLL